jgi:hypothetical protein
MPVENDLEWAVSRTQQTLRRDMYDLYRKYFDGVQPIAFATAKFKAAFFDVFKNYHENLCEPVIDALNDRLTVTGFRSSQAEAVEEERPSQVEGVPSSPRVVLSDPFGELAWKIWGRNKMDIKSQEVHENSLKSGDSYVIVWPDENRRAAIWPHTALDVDVQYDPQTPGVIQRALKIWFDDLENHWYLNIYLRTHIAKYRARREGSDFPRQEQEWVGREGWVPNPWGIVPVFHFPNNAENKYGVSELSNVVPVQDGLNKAVVDMMVAMEFAAFKQRYAIGYESEIDEETGQPKDANAKSYGVDRFLAFPDPETKVGQFDATDLQQFLRVQEKFWSAASRVSGTPLHYFFITEGDFPSGEAMKSAEARFVKKITDRQTSFGNQWERVINFSLMIEDEFVEDLTFQTMWTDATPRSDAEIADTAVKKRTVGVPNSQLLKEMGYSDEEIERFLKEYEAGLIARAKLKQMENPPEEDTGEPTGDQGRAARGVRR